MRDERVCSILGELASDASAVAALKQAQFSEKAFGNNSQKSVSAYLYDIK